MSRYLATSSHSLLAVLHYNFLFNPLYQSINCSIKEEWLANSIEYEKGVDDTHPLNKWCELIVPLQLLFIEINDVQS